MAVSDAWRRRIDQGFQRNLADWPLIRRELAALFPALSEEEALCLRAVYAGLGPQDLASIPAGQHLEDVRTALLARRELDRQVGEELFFLYVLPARVNNEFPDGSRPWLYEQLRDRVKGLGLAETALEVNYWCYAHATYAPADDRTMGPRGVCSRARGRCGEESTLLTAALRAVGVPARQVYAPRWAHCDDNHAWVEFWDGTGWRYMGACEPEEAPDRGWFTSAASRSMLVRALEPDLENGGCRVVNVTARYARTVRLAVRAERGGLPVPGVSVRFQLVNDSQLWTIFQGETDGAGETSMETGLGCLVVSAWFGGRLTEKLVDLRKERTVTLAWEAGFDPLETEREVLWELTPPAGIVPPPAPNPGSAHLERLRQCEAERRACEDTFVKKGPRPLVCAGGNRGEIEKFLALPDYDREDKEALLGSLRDKDFADITCEVLEDFLLAALPWKEKYEPRIWRREILSARVENEPLLPVRCEIAARLAGEGLRDRADVLRWMDGHLRPAEEHGLTDRRGDGAAYLRHGICPPSERRILAEQICRALGIRGVESAPGKCRLILRSREGPLRYRERFTLSRWEGTDYRTLDLDGVAVRDVSLLGGLSAGSYRLVVTRRQIDGTVSARVYSFRLAGERTIDLAPIPDRTAEKLLSAALPSVKVKSLTDGAAEDLTAPTDAGSLLLFLRPGAEPTEHLLRELLELRETCREGEVSIRFLLESREAAENRTLQRCLEEIPSCACFLPEEASIRERVRLAMGVGDARLPLAVVLDRFGRGRFALANYNIRAAHTLLKILELVQAPA